MEYKDINDYELCYMVRENDDDSLNLLYRKYNNLIYKICKKFYIKYQYIGIEFEDLMQEAKIGILKALRGYNDEESLFYTYLNICVERQLITYCKNYNSLKNYPLNYSLGEDNFLKLSTDTIQSNSLELLLIENEWFLECKNLLKFNQSIIFELRYNNFTYKEIAILLDIKLTTVDGRIQTIRKKLKNNLKYVN